MNLSFAGCGFLGLYHVGVGACFERYAPQLLINKISGASAGALAACCLLCKVPLCSLAHDVLNVALEARRHRLGAFNPNFNISKIMREELEKSLPPNCHEIVSGKLHVSLTRMPDGKNVVVSEFKSKQHLIDILISTSFIPIFSGALPPLLDGVRYVDGCFSDNLLTLDEHTVTVSPFCGETDICPEDDTAQLLHFNVANTSVEVSKMNAYRMMRILFPPRPEALATVCWQGFDDALRFMKKNNLLKCEDCAITRPISKEELKELDDDCDACRRHQKEAMYSGMPESVIQIFENAIEKANKGFMNWLFKMRAVKILSLLALPCLFPIDVMYAIVTKLITSAPHIGPSIWEVTVFVIEVIKKVVLNLVCHETAGFYKIMMYDV